MGSFILSIFQLMHGRTIGKLIDWLIYFYLFKNHSSSSVYSPWSCILHKCPPLCTGISYLLKSREYCFLTLQVEQKKVNSTVSWKCAKSFSPSPKFPCLGETSFAVLAFAVFLNCKVNKCVCVSCLKLSSSTMASTSSMAGIQSLDRSNRTWEKGIACRQRTKG